LRNADQIQVEIKKRTEAKSVLFNHEVG